MYPLILLLSELLPQFIFIYSPHIDGTQRKMMCKFEATLVVTFRAKYPCFLDTAADAKAQPFVSPTLLIRRVLIDAVFIGSAPTVQS